MPVLRSREIPFHSPLPKTLKRKRPASAPLLPPSPPPPPLAPSTPAVRDRSVNVRRRRRQPDASSSSTLGLGMSGRRRRSLRLASMANGGSDDGAGYDGGLDLNRDADEMASGNSSGSCGRMEIDLNAHPTETGGHEADRGGRADKGKEFVVVLDDSDDGADAGRRRRKYTAKEKGKGKLVAEDEGMTVDGTEDELEALLSGNSGRGGAGLEELAGALLIEDDWLSLGIAESLKDELDSSAQVGVERSQTAFEQGHRVDVPKAIGKKKRPGEPEGISGRRVRERAQAMEAAARFAYYRSEDVQGEEEEANDNDAAEEAVADAEDWPGPFSTAMKMINEREDRLRARLARIDVPQVDILWKPTRRENICRVAPSLRDLCVKILSENVEEIPSLEGIPSGLRRQLGVLVCGLRKMDFQFLSLLVTGGPTDIHVPDCSWADEDKFEGILSNCNTEDLKVLQFDLSGRCLSDHVLRSTLARAPNSLPKLVDLSLCGNYRLSDNGLDAIACSAPNLRSINLRQCSFLTSAGIINLAEKLENVIRELILDHCPNVDALQILPALKKLKNLEKLSVSGLEGVSDKFVRGLVVSVRGPHLKKLGFADCKKLSPKSIKTIGLQCPQLTAIDLRRVSGVNDDAIAYLASGCRSIEELMLLRNNCSDEGIASFVEASGQSLVKLSLNSVEEVSCNTALAIVRRCSSSLKELDLSFCRLMTDEALGLIVDSCPHLEILKLFGCTQVTDAFLNGHSSPGVKIIGLSGPILTHLGTPGFKSHW